MLSFGYLGFLLAGIVGMLLIDRRFGLFFWRDAAAAAVVTVAGTVLLLLWDAAGIAAGIFRRGGADRDAEIAVGIEIAPELPIEEPVFLVFLVICTMVLYTGAQRLLTRRERRSEP